MNPELCKKLKDAGYSPQLSEYGGRYHWAGFWVLDGIIQKDCPVSTNLPQQTKESYYVPTLSELIEACGKEFSGLDKRDDGWSVTANMNDFTGFEYPNLRVVGRTPEEAVANLYISLYNDSNAEEKNKNK